MLQTKGRKTAKVKRIVQTEGRKPESCTNGISRMLTHKKQSKQKVGNLRAAQIRGKMLMYKNNAMQTIHLSQALHLI